MKTKLFTLFVAIVATTALWASTVITYTATEELPEVTDYWSFGLHTNAFNVAITSHEFSNGTGTITFAGEVTTIGERAFYECTGLTSITIPNSVTTIGYMAFAWCEGLTSVTIPNSVTAIGVQAFAWCTGLTSINVDAANTHYCSIDGVLFNYAKDTLIQYPIGNTRTEYTIPNSVTTIGERAFICCSGLTSISIPHFVTTIGDWAFAYCNGLTSVTIPNSVTTIGDLAFSGCTSLPVIDNLRYADTYLVEAVDKTLSTYTIKDGTKWIGSDAFYDCSGLISVTIPNSVTMIGEYAFLDCSKLTSITIPNSVTTIEYGAFENCTSLTSITIPNSVTTIGELAFFGCTGLTSITIGNSVTTIGERAFYECTGLTSITCYAVTPPECYENAFKNISQDAKVYVPASALTDYQNAKEWKDMQLFPIAAEVTPMEGDNPIVTPTDQDVTITWPITDGTDTYTLTITKNGEVVCVLTFNANGQLTNIAFAAPGHNDAHQAPAATLTAQGYQFTVTGLNPGTAYDYSVTATDAGGQTLAEHKGNFSTTGGTGLNTLPYEGKDGIGSKYFHNGNLIIERNGIKYTATGQKVR